MNWKDFGLNFFQATVMAGLSALISDKIAKRVSAGDFVQIVRMIGKIISPQLTYFHDLPAKLQQKVILDDPQIANPHEDWLFLKSITRYNTAFFGKAPTAGDFLYKCGPIEFEADGKTPKPIPANGAGYALRTGYFAYTSKGGFHIRFGQRYDINTRRFNLSFAAKMVN